MRKAHFVPIFGLFLVSNACGFGGKAQSTLSEGARPESAGYVDIMPADQATALRAILPQVEDAAIRQALSSPETMWYDHASLKPVYQDSVTPILGVRANAIGRELAVDGHKVFDTSQRFHFPFSTTAGTDRSPNVVVANFWAPPREGGRAWPVAWWTDDTTRWRWVFPKGTILGEIMMIKDPRGGNVVFEIRTRTRYLEGWETHAFRPFNTAQELEQAIMTRRPGWETNVALAALVRHLRTPATLSSATHATQFFPATFDRVDGFVDILPDFGDDALVVELLRGTPFKSAEGTVWKRDGSRETYAASTRSTFSIVPREYEGGLIPVNDVSCNRCHEDTGRQIGEFSFNSLLYGEFWGEDRIFTWHLFDESGNFNGAYHNNRVMNRRFEQAGLVARYQAGSAATPDSMYKVLPRRFRIIYR